jgi:hypothetical protein
MDGLSFRAHREHSDSASRVVAALLLLLVCNRYMKSMEEMLESLKGGINHLRHSCYYMHLLKH